MSSSAGQRVFLSFILVGAIFFLLLTALQLLRLVSTSIGFKELVIIWSVFLIFVLFSLLIIKFNIHSKILWPIRRTLINQLAAMTINRWETNIKVLPSGDAAFTTRVYGRVNFGLVKWLQLNIWADTPQRADGKFVIRVTDLSDRQQVTPTLTVDSPRFKEFRINFGRSLERGDKFAYGIEYKFRRVFQFDKMSEWSHKVSHNEKEYALSIQFPEETFLDFAYAEAMTEYGDFRKELHAPDIVKPNLIRWHVKQPALRHKYIIRWKALKKHNTEVQPDKSKKINP